MIHLDLKPSNIFITGEGRFKIGDFGMASLWPRPAPPTASQLETESVVSGFEREGDKMYLAPEVLQGRYGKAADVFRYARVSPGSRGETFRTSFSCHVFFSFLL